MTTSKIDVDALSNALKGIVDYCETVEERLHEAEQRINRQLHAGGGISSAKSDIELDVDTSALDAVRDAIDRIQG